MRRTYADRATSRAAVSLERCDLAGFDRVAAAWDRLATDGDSPFLTAAWVGSWWRAFGRECGFALLLRGDDGEIVAAGCFLESGRSTLSTAANAHSNDWSIVARDDAAAARFWAGLAALGNDQVVLEPLHSGGEALAAPRVALRQAGYRLVEEELEPSPWLGLPESLEALLSARSRNLRSQVGRRRRALGNEGELALRVVRGGTTLERDLDSFFELEAAGWKGSEGTGTAIANDPALLELYRGFAAEAASSGMLRLYLLELDGRLIAGDYGCVFGGCGYLVKTAFDESLGRMAPGLVLRAEVLQASIEEGLTRYDFLGGPDAYKLRWADEARGRAVLRAFRGIRAAPAHAWWASLRPAAKSARDLARTRVPSWPGRR
jgi:CelD/BcsL family acetyltransferase involved in cellulose biosynthesis